MCTTVTAYSNNLTNISDLSLVTEPYNIKYLKSKVTRQTMLIQRNFEAPSHNLGSVEYLYKKFCACVCVCSLALVIQHAQRMGSTTLSLVTSLAVPYLYTLSHKRHNFWQRNENKMCVLVLFTTGCATLHFIARNQQHIAINVQRASRKVRLLCGIVMKLEFYSHA